MSKKTKSKAVKPSIPKDRKKALRRMRALHEQIREQMNKYSGKSNKKARKKYKKLKKSRNRMKQAFYEVTLADRRKWKKIRSRITQKYEKAARTLKKAQS
ncbi:MAG TPA: hypothetical protein VJ953_21890 [Saprospiraceae bacterium]|nr:hypothetical protein [Saprospiraceae bacterium]